MTEQASLRATTIFVIAAMTPAFAVAADAPFVTSKVRAIEAYENGFAYDVIRAADGQGVGLNDLVLIENDAPGAGFSQKGPCTEPIHKDVLARKVLFLENPVAHDAHVVLFMVPKDVRKKQMPYYLIVNGRRIEGNPVPWHEGTWHWVRVGPGVLKKGANEVVVGCDAPIGLGYDLLIAREDEYEDGGGRFTYAGNTAKICAGQISVSPGPVGSSFHRIEVGTGSARSGDRGEGWQVGKLGGANDILGEYTIRLNLKQYHCRGILQSAPLDLWSGLPGFDNIRPICEVQSLELEVLGETPPGTKIVWSVRFGDTADLGADHWSEFQSLGTGAEATFTPANEGRRYLQWQAELTTDDRLKTPVVRGVTVRRRLRYERPSHGVYAVLNWENIQHRYSSFKFTREDPFHPTLGALRRRLKLDEVLTGARGDFERINRLRHHVSTLWKHALPLTEYPEWSAMEILDRKQRLGTGGMCIQFSVVLIQALQSMGYHARHVNVFAHETVEVYVDELGKWVHVDPESLFDSYEYNIETGEPINVLEQHQHFLAGLGFSADTPIDWMSTDPWSWPVKEEHARPQPLAISTFTGAINDPKQPPPQHRLAGFLRIIPRNDFLAWPKPRPVNHGLFYHWPWNGYVNWYDEATPRKLQYALHTDRRADFYPTLNRVEFTATHGEKPGALIVDMLTFAPNFDRFEINADETGWRDSSERFVWTLRPAAMNTLQMRVRNRSGPLGKPSRVEVLWHYLAPFDPPSSVAIRDTHP